MKSKLRKVMTVVGALTFVVGALAAYSYGRLLEFERRHMPKLDTLSPPSTRNVRFKLCDPWVCYLPHWRLSYNECEVKDVKYVSPAISVDFLGRLRDGASQHVWMSMER